jgi:plastocyanin
LAIGTFALAAGCAAPAPPGVVVITCKGKQFNPPVVTIRPGTTVRWINEDDTAHTTTSLALAAQSPTTTVNQPDQWNSNPLNPGDHFDHKFEKSGTFPFQCLVHPYMEGTVTVEAK